MLNIDGRLRDHEFRIEEARPKPDIITDEQVKVSFILVRTEIVSFRVDYVPRANTVVTQDEPPHTNGRVVCSAT